MQAYSLWINHLPSVRAQLRDGATSEDLVAADSKTRGKEMDQILASLLPLLKTVPNTPVIVGGDFNSGSHLDWTAAAAHLPNHHGRVVPWPAGVSMAKAGFVDTFRAANPNPVTAPGHTWSPEFPDSHQDRIDYVYVRGSRLARFGIQGLVQASGWLAERSRGGMGRAAQPRSSKQALTDGHESLVRATAHERTVRETKFVRITCGATLNPTAA